MNLGWIWWHFTCMILLWVSELSCVSETTQSLTMKSLFEAYESWPIRPLKKPCVFWGLIFSRIFWLRFVPPKEHLWPKLGKTRSSRTWCVEGPPYSSRPGKLADPVDRAVPNILSSLTHGKHVTHKGIIRNLCLQDWRHTPCVVSMRY